MFLSLASSCSQNPLSSPHPPLSLSSLSLSPHTPSPSLYTHQLPCSRDQSSEKLAFRGNVDVVKKGC